jgi:hypothetical protein
LTWRSSRRRWPGSGIRWMPPACCCSARSTACGRTRWSSGALMMARHGRAAAGRHGTVVRRRQDHRRALGGATRTGRVGALRQARWRGRQGHAPTGPTSLGAPLGAYRARQRLGVRSIRFKYSGGRFRNLEPRRFRPRVNAWRNHVRPRQQRGYLVLYMPGPTEATVPQRPWERRATSPA